jgi:hypothetical protein
MKTISRSKALNPAFKRFQYLPDLPHSKPAEDGLGLATALAEGMEVPGPARMLERPTEVMPSAMADCFCSQTCE